MFYTDIYDLHCDTLTVMYNNGFDIHENCLSAGIEKLKNGNVKLQCFAIYPDNNIFYGKDDGCFEYFINCADLFDKIKPEIKSNGITPVLTVEDCELLNGDIARVDVLKKQGVKTAGLLWNRENCLGFPHTEANKGLKKFGFQVVERLNELNIIPDVSHLSIRGFYDVALCSKKPFVATHSCVYSICPNSRNLDDEQLRTLANSGGVVGINYYSRFLKDGSDFAKISEIVNHIAYAVNMAGSEAVALGSDFDGTDTGSEIPDASYCPVLAEALIKALGFNTAEKVCYKNAKNLLRQD